MGSVPAPTHGLDRGMMMQPGAKNLTESRRSVKYVSHGDAGGYGLSGIAYLHGLRGAGVPVSWTPLFPTVGGYAAEASPDAALRRLRDPALPPETADLYEAVTRDVACDICVLHTVPELWAAHRQPHCHHIGYTVWELTTAPPHWPALLASMEQLLTPSRLSADALANAGVPAPIEIVPHLFRPPAATADGARFRALHGIPREHTLFYTVNTWIARKAVWRTLHAYCSAFSAADPTTLVVKTSAFGPAHEGDARQHPVQQLVRALIANYPAAPHVCLIVRHLTQAEMDDLHAAGNCYVSLTHAEGWGLGAFDAACAGRPVVMTGWGGHLDYLSASDALLVDYQLVPVHDRLGASSYRSDQLWALADLDDAIARMQWVHDHRTDSVALGERLGARLRQQYARDGIIARLAEILGA
jgi:glycosyltransferase involved in cell wall biosynthesis